MGNFCQNCKSNNIKFIYETYDYISQEKFQINKCLNCHLLFPIEYPKDIDKYYPKKYRSYVPIVNKVINIKSKLYVKSVIKKFSRSSRNFKNKILEIGCGNGEMLKIFKDLDWEVFGSERTSIIQENNALNISNKPINEYPNKYFDLILLYNSFEHLHDPKETLKIITSKIKKNGLIVISVPSHDSYQSKFGKQDWLHLDAPRHLNIFSLASFEHMIRDIENISVLEIISHKSISFDLEFYGWFQTILNKFYTENNLFHKYLQNINKNKLNFYIGLMQLFILSVPCAILGLYSMVVNKGAITETVLKKKTD